MRIAFIAAGASGMYCGSCLHDNTLAVALQRKGIDFALIPTYTPLRTDELNASIDRVFYGGINVFLQQKLPLFRRAPRFLGRLLDNRTLLNGLARFSGSTRPEDLGALTVSVLAGEEGAQQKELAKLVDWLTAELKPDLVHLTNSMFVGMAGEIKRALDVPVLCSFQGEDIFLDSLIEPYRSEALALLREKAQGIDGFIATCEYYADFMSEYAHVPRARVQVVRLGINLHGHGPRLDPLPPEPFTTGYLARICPEKGLDVLAEAFRQLAESVGSDRVRLRAAGYLGRRDEAYFTDIQRRIETWGLSDSFEYVGEVGRDGKIEFLRGNHVLSVPTPYREPKGLFLLEAMANGIPVVQPRHGAFPEWIEATGGGLLVEPDSPEALATGLLNLMNDPERREQLGRAGMDAVRRSYHDEAMADATLAVYRQFVPVHPGRRTR